MKPHGNKIRILIVDDVPESRQGLARLLSIEPDMDVIGYAVNGIEAVEQAQELEPDVILMDINMPDMDGLTATKTIMGLVRTSVVMISVQMDHDYLRQALRVGAKDFVAKPPAADELYATIRNAYRRLHEDGFLLPELKPPPPPPQRGKIVVVYSPQGGSGVTTLAVNLASGFMRGGKQAVLIDANLQFGDVAVHLAVSNERNITQLARTAHDLDFDLIENTLYKHGSGLRVLPAPPAPEDAEAVRPEALVKVVEALATKFDYVVLDTATYLNDITLSLLELADMVVMVGVAILPCVRNLKATLNLFEHFKDFRMEKIVLVMNKVSSDRKSGMLDVQAIARTLHCDIHSTIPLAEKPLLSSLNRGIPVIVQADKTPGHEILKLVERLRARLEGGEPEVASPPMPATRSRHPLLQLIS